MKATELMIGDWVLQNDTLHQNRPCRIAGIYDDVIVDVTGEKVPLHESHLNPIPLTEEILNKNGFYFYRINELCSNSNYFNEDEELKLELSLGRSGKIFWTVNATEYILMPLDYVHQLQHALRLCGIEKEIKV